MTFCSLGIFMKKTSSSDHLESTTLGWKFVAIIALITTIFFTFLYLAMSHEPDYMPSRKAKVAQQEQINSPQPTPVEQATSEE